MIDFSFLEERLKHQAGQFCLVVPNTAQGYAKFLMQLRMEGVL